MPQQLILGRIDSPEADSTVALGWILVTGWVFGTSSPVSRVELALDDRPQGSASLAWPRPDVVAALENDAAELSGFQFRLDLRRLDWLRDQVDLSVSAILLNGERADLPPVRISVASRLGTSSVQPGGGRIRLLCFAQSLDYGGSQLRMREMIEFLGKTNEFEITVLTPTEGPLRRDLEAAGAVVRIRPIPFDKISAYEEQLTQLAHWAAGRFDVTLGFTLACFAAVDLGERLALPSLWRIGDCKALATIVEWLGGHLDPEVERRADRAFATASLVFFNSENALRFFVDLGHFGHFAVLGNGTDVEAAASYRQTNDKDACRRSLGIAPDRRVLLCTGTLWPVKGQALLVSALAHVHADYPHLECVLVGQQNKDYVDFLCRLIDRLGLAKFVRVLPFSDDLRAWRCAADVAVSASEHESMSASILEAMAFGLPVLSSRVGGADEVVEDGVTGWLYEPNDLGSLIEGIRRVAAMESEDLRALGEQAMYRVRLAHDRALALSRTADLIRDVSRGLTPRWLELKCEPIEDELSGDHPDISHEVEAIVMVANHLVIVGRAPSGDGATEADIADLPIQMVLPIQACCRPLEGQRTPFGPRGVGELGFVAVCPLDFDSAKLLAEKSDPLQVTLKFASGAVCERALTIASFAQTDLTYRREAIRMLCKELAPKSPDFAQILASLADEEHLSSKLVCHLDRHLVAPECGFVATGRAERLGSNHVVFLLDGMKLAINPNQIFQNLPEQEPVRAGVHNFVCIETIEGMGHELRLAALGQPEVRWSSVLVLANTGSPRDLIQTVAKLLPERVLLHLVATGDILFQIVQHFSKPYAATVAVSELKRGVEAPEFSIIIPFYRDGFFLLDHIESQRRTDARAEWILVCDDPGLLPSMLDTCRGRRDELRKPTKLLALGENVGFAAANNIALQHAGGDYVVFMNSDIYWTSLEPIQYATRILREDASIGVVGFSLYFEDGTIQHAGMRLKVAPERNDMLATVHEGKGLPSRATTSEVRSREVEAVTAALMVVRRRDFPDGVFSEEYIGGDFEDVDLCLEMRARGKKIVLVDCDGLYHLERQSIKVDPVHRLLSFLNCARFTQKWHPDGRKRL